MDYKTRWLLLGVLCLAFLLTTACQRSDWQSNNAAGLKALQQGRYADAEKLLVAAVEEAEGFGPQDLRLAATLDSLAGLYRAQGKYARAEPLFKRALAIYENALGPEHPIVATDLNNLAALYQTQGKYADAEPFHKRALAIWEKALGPDHPYVAQSLEIYAVLLRNMNREDEAAKMEALETAILASIGYPDPYEHTGEC